MVHLLLVALNLMSVCVRESMSVCMHVCAHVCVCVCVCVGCETKRDHEKKYLSKVNIYKVMEYMQ